MNEHYAVEPTACVNAAELRHLLERFGPYAGRYIAAFPRSWRQDVRATAMEWSDLEQARVTQSLRRASERCAVVWRRDLEFDASKTWVQNFKATQSRKRPFAGAVVARENCDTDLPSIDDLELATTADEKIAGLPKEYARVSSTLLTVSPEVTLIDPYLDPVRDDRRRVLLELLRAAKSGRCRKFRIYARATAMSQPEAIEDTLRELLRKAGDPVKEFEMNLVEDAHSSDKLHARYLLSVRGALRFDRGFQTLPAGRKNDISVVGEGVHRTLVQEFMEDRHGLEVVSRLVVHVDIPPKQFAGRSRSSYSSR